MPLSNTERLARSLVIAWSLLGSLLLAPALLAADDILVADFEQPTYGEWIAEGEAFGPGPAEGTLPGQMAVSGFQGQRLVNSFYQGDKSTGTLISPPFTVERRYLTFLIGGGAHEEKTCIQLLRNGKVLRSASGPNDRPGGSEELSPHFWDVSELRGERVTLRIVDQATGGWGHINIDQILLTDTRPNLPVLERRERTFTVDRKYLIVPIQNGARATELVLEINGTPVRRYQTELAVDPERIDWYAFFDLNTYQGQQARLSVARGSAEGFELVRQADQVPGSERWYTEPLRPQFHFSQSVGWNNDPNGMVYHEGRWHLFFQHNPVGWNWGNMTWGHAVSTDLVHWRQLPNALFPKTTARGDCFSGGGTIDVRNTAGWKTGDRDVLVVFLTDTGAGESVAYSNDGGESFQWYEGNPVVKHKGRDPKVVWYEYDADDTPLNDKARESGGHWVMAVYDETESFGRNIAFYTSVDLKQWTEQSHLPGYYECPELFELPVDGRADDRRWVVFAADAQYALGQFDGRTFRPEHDGKHQVHWGPYYASQTFEHAPDGRRIQMGWARIAAPGMPFNQMFSFPHELSLRNTDEGVRLHAQPVAEIEKLHVRTHERGPLELAETPLVIQTQNELFDVRAEVEVGTATKVHFDVGGHRVTYDVEAGRLHEAPLKTVDGRLRLQILADRPMLEICGNDGRAYITTARRPSDDRGQIRIATEGGQARLVELRVHELCSIWD